MLNKIKSEILNFGLKFVSVDEKIVRMILETASSNVNEIVILPATKIVMKKLIQKLQNKVTHGRVYNGLLNGIKVSIIRSQMGCPNTALVIECLKRSKAKIVIRVDICGGVVNAEDSIEVGNIVIPRLAYCDDGTSPQYIRTNPSIVNQLESINNPLSSIQNIITGNQTIFISKPNQILNEILLREANSLIKAIEADLWTTDALFCETFEFVRVLDSINVKVIDMESSILFLLGMLYNLKTASILSISDLPGHPEYDLLHSNELHPNMEKGIETAIKILISSLPKIKSVLI
ncbi:MAG: hypothetical protein ACFFFB_17400 [Candidatus Heimdallarchaeota archaeon]